MVTLDDSLRVLAERRDWLTARIQAKETIGWDVEWDVRERNALATVIAWFASNG